VRGRVGETYLDEQIPLEVRNLYPANIPLTHFWAEIEIENNWRILDASYDPELAKVGFIVNEWDSNRTCFEITKAYTHEEIIEYQTKWSDPECARSYFEAIGQCATALNNWFETLRMESK